MWKKSQFLKTVRDKIAEIDAMRKADATDADPFVSTTYHNERQYRAAMRWFKGEDQPYDFRIESTLRDGKWQHALVQDRTNRLFTVEG